MKNNNIILKMLFLFSGILIILTIGCSPTVTNLQTVEVSGPPHRHLIRITENKKEGDFEIHSQISFNQQNKLKTKTEGHTDVNRFDVYELEPIPESSYYREHAGVNIYPFERDNLIWTIPGWQCGIDLDLAMSDKMAITGGVDFAKIYEDYFWGQNIGIGFFEESETWAWRFDFLWKFQQMFFDAELVITEDKPLRYGETRNVLFKYYSEMKYNRNFSTLLTFNSVRNDWPINFFSNFGIGTQTFYDASTKFNIVLLNTDAANFRYSRLYYVLNFGIFANLTQNRRVLFGMGLIKYDDEKGQLLVPNAFIQYDFKFK